MPPSLRQRRHLLPNALVVAYLAAAALVAAVPRVSPMPRWLALHLLLLGAASTAIVIWGAHWGEAVLHVRPAGIGGDLARVGVLNAGVVAVLVGVAGRHSWLAVAGAAVVALVALAHVGRLGLLAVRAPSARLRIVVWFYVVAGLALVAGAALGALLEAGGVAGGAAHRAAVSAHAYVNLLGWIALTVLGTQIIMWPSMLRTRMPDVAPGLGRWVLALGTAGLVATTAGLLARLTAVTTAGLTTYAVAVALSLGPFLRTARQRRPSDGAAWGMAAGTAWLAVALVVDVVSRATGRGDRGIQDAVPLLAAGFVAQVLVAALTFLIPAFLGGGPHGNRQLARILDMWWPARVVVTNVGVLLVALPLTGAARTAGWAVTLVGLGSFVPLAATALGTVARGPRREAPAPPAA